MSGKITKIMKEAYRQDAMPTMFLSGMFRATPRSFHNSEEVEIDIVRSDEDISVAITDLSTGSRINSEDQYTNKSFKPPVHKEAGPVSAHTLIGRMPGQDPFAQPDFQANAIQRGQSLGNKLQNKIARAVEYQSAQVLTTGKVDLIDDQGNTVYNLDYSPKTSHFPTVSTSWSDANSTPLADIAALANQIRSDGLAGPDMLIMGAGAFEDFLANTDVQAVFEGRRANRGTIVPLELMGNGGIYRGTVEIENYSYDIWTYDGRYKHPQTGVSTKFIPDDKVIVRASSGRLDATFGGIPRIASPDPRVPTALTQRISIPEMMLDIQMNAWITNDGETLWVQAGTRPLMIPTAIDTFGCLTTTA